ncbi:MAG TPA: orotidine-5'-phosphate decarboxylase [Bacillus sp. (in: firmicutes)]|uniref:orotidine-5'-phosphate decarboxylase n=1 Tax=Bacillus litorisediminis TaxID=2922713 RepID=UPI001FAC1525|nr:orotidine-5'-phosphate decarboxylase [Bacillus litorisediminis]HWO77891.1 orotidine-5'-phosphate decarboxylase [Bacillus sp. (in: firmicutes)]
MTKSPIIVALDFPSLSATKTFLEKFEGESLFVKVGMELFYQEGPKIIEFLKAQDHAIFLDLKLHDIPNTVYSAMKGLAQLGVDLINVHAFGGSEMMRRAVEGLEDGKLQGTVRPLCIAVTQLTSTSAKQLKEETFVDLPLEQMVEKQAALASQSGMDGVVCSPLESKRLKELLGHSFITVTPGIRPLGSEQGDQHRITTPAEAKRLKASYIVVGRPITKADNPFEAYTKIKQEWEETRQ